MDVNFLGVLSLSRAALPLIRQARGRLIALGSVVGLVSIGGGLSAYGASKLALEPHGTTRCAPSWRPRASPSRVSVSGVSSSAAGARHDACNELVLYTHPIKTVKILKIVKGRQQAERFPVGGCRLSRE